MGLFGFRYSGRAWKSPNYLMRNKWVEYVKSVMDTDLSSTNGVLASWVLFYTPGPWMDNSNVGLHAPGSANLMGESYQL